MYVCVHSCKRLNCKLAITFALTNTHIQMRSLKLMKFKNYLASRKRSIAATRVRASYFQYSFFIRMHTCSSS